MKIIVNEKGAEALKLLLDSYLRTHWINGKNNVDAIINAIRIADPKLLEWDEVVEKAEQQAQEKQQETQEGEQQEEWNQSMEQEEKTHY